MVWPESDGAGWGAWVSASGAYPGLSGTRSCTAADKFVGSDPDQSYYQFWSRPKPLPSWLWRCGPTWPDACLWAPHTPMLLRLMARTAVCVCAVSPAGYHEWKILRSAISSIKLCLRALYLLIVASNWVFSQSTSTVPQNLLFPLQLFTLVKSLLTCPCTHIFVNVWV